MGPSVLVDVNGWRWCIMIIVPPTERFNDHLSLVIMKNPLTLPLWDICEPCWEHIDNGTQLITPDTGCPLTVFVWQCTAKATISMFILEPLSSQKFPVHTRHFTQRATLPLQQLAQVPFWTSVVFHRLFHIWHQGHCCSSWLPLSCLKGCFPTLEIQSHFISSSFQISASYCKSAQKHHVIQTVSLKSTNQSPAISLVSGCLESLGWTVKTMAYR